MSRPTPRKQRHQKHPSLSQTLAQSQAQSHGQHSHGHRHSNSQIFAQSDYESDTAAYMASHPTAGAPLPARTNTELNLSVLRRYIPSITNILSIAANAVVYTFATEAGSWEKTGVEGTLFVCAQDGGMGPNLEKACLFVLNRRGLDNLVLDLGRVAAFEVMDALLIFKVDGDSDDSGEEKTLGLWLHASAEEDTRQLNAALIQETWQLARQTEEQKRAAGVDSDSGRAEAGPAMQAMGRRVSLSELFSGGIAG